MENTKNKKAALYVRVSTDAQVEEGYSIDAQKEMLANHCKTKGIKHFEYYVDGGFTGSNLDRPEMQRLIANAKANEIDYVLIYRLDRMSRSQRDTLYLIEDIFLPHGIDLISLNESLDTSTPFGRAMISIMATFAQLERENIRERTRMGMKERVKSGLWPGGGRVPFGYDYDQNTGILVQNEDAERVRKAYDLYLQGHSTNRIAKALNIKYERIVMQVLMRKLNAGYIVYNEEEYTGQHEPIISLETYQRTMEMMRERATNRMCTSNYLLTGLVYCGKCGAKMRYQKWGKGENYDCKLCCYSQDKNKPHLCKDPNCNNGRVWASEVESEVIKELTRLSFDQKGEKGEDDTNNNTSILDELNMQHARYSDKIGNLYRLYADAPNQILLDTIGKMQKEQQKITSAITAEQEKSTYIQKATEIKLAIRNFTDMWEFATTQERRNAIKMLVEKIVITDGDIQLYLKLFAA